MMTIQEFVKKHGIKITCSRVDSNPNFDGSDDGREFARKANHYFCRLRIGKRRLNIHFSQGCLISKQPRAEDVINCLASDVIGYLQADGSFERWASEYGYSSDSRYAEKIYNVCGKESKQLAKFLGNDALLELLHHTESM